MSIFFIVSYFVLLVVLVASLLALVKVKTIVRKNAVSKLASELTNPS